MAGKKKPTRKQMSKRQSSGVRQNKERRNVRVGKVTKDKQVIGITLPDVKSKKVLGTLKAMKVLTPYMVASRFDLRLGVAKDFLEALQRRKLIEYVSGGRNLKIYKISDNNPNL
jgi:ribosomal protein S25